MTAVKSLELDFKFEVDQTGFGNAQWEDNSYQYMLTIIENSKVDKTIKSKILELLNNMNVSLQEAYLNVISFLDEIQ